MNTMLGHASRRTVLSVVGVLILALFMIIVVSLAGLAPDFDNDRDNQTSIDLDGSLIVTVFDVGQAQSVAAVLPDGTSMLIDTSRSGKRVADLIVPYLQSLGVDELDFLVLSHPDQDHIGGTPRLLELFPVQTLVDPVIPSTNQTYAETLEIALDLEINAIVARRGDQLAAFDGGSVQILWPDEPLLESGGEPDSNENSVVIQISYGSTSVLVTGDIGFDAEEILVDVDAGELESDVLVVGHHGSAGSSSGPFLDAVNPDVAIISAGLDNPYGHPTDEVIRRLRLRNIDIYRTDLDGTIEIQSDGDEYTIELLESGGLP